MNFLRRLFDAITYPLRALFSSPAALLSAPRRLLGMSLPMRIAVVVALLLIGVTIAVYVAFFFQPGRAGWGVLMQPRYLVSVILLLIVIPVVVFFTAKLWLQVEGTEFPDIDDAWRQGLRSLRAKGVDPLSLPIYLLHGFPNATQAHAFFDASRIDLVISGVPGSEGALHWYASSDGIFLCCTNASCLGLLSSRATDAHGFAADVPKGGGPDLRGTILAEVWSAEDGSISLHDTASPEDRDAEPTLRVPTTPLQGGATMDISAYLAGQGSGADSGQTSPSRRELPKRLKKLLSKEAYEQARRLEYVCDLLCRLRQPVCPLNGILTILPYQVLQQSDDYGSEVQAAATADLKAIRESTQIRCPAIVVVAGMETQDGFRELVKRVGPERAITRRFGQGYGVWSVPIDKEIASVAAIACGQFEDWAYALFQEADGLQRKGNAQLYTLLCHVRGEIKDRITHILSGSFGVASEKDAERLEPLLFSGCYFAATGATKDRQAFVQSILARLVENQDDMAWTRQSENENRYYQRLADTFMIINGLLLMGLVGMIAWRIFWWD